MKFLNIFIEKRTFRFSKYEFEVVPAFFLLICIGFLIRVIGLNNVPGGLNQDEAFSGYEAYSLLHYGKDSFGNPFPVYFVSWGSGMNVLNSYLMIPFIALFGVHTWVIRLPQVIVACASLVVFYKLLKEFFNEKQALCGLAFFVVCPWHIMMSRWGLESNLAPGFLLFALYCFVLGSKNSKYYIFSALFYGLSLYCYATIWPIVPVLLILIAAYMFYVKKLKLSKNLIIAVFILGFFAMPLLFFLLINKGYMNEIVLPHFSIPKLVVMRESEISFSNIPANLKNLWNILWTQSDGLIWNTTEKFGLYYKFGLIPAILGLIYSLYRTIKSLIKRNFDGHAIIVLQFLTAIILGALVSVNVNRINCIHISIITFIGIALYQFIKLISKKIPYGWISAIIIFGAVGCCFISFTKYYFTDYSKTIAPYFHDGLQDSVDYAMSAANDNETIYVSSMYSYSKLLLFSQCPVDEYLETVEYTNYPSAYLGVKSFGQFSFDYKSYSKGNIYIVDKGTGEYLENYGYTVNYFGETAVAQ